MRSNNLRSALLAGALCFSSAAPALADIQNPPVRVVSATLASGAAQPIQSGAIGASYPAGTLLVQFDSVSGTGGTLTASASDSKANSWTCAPVYNSGASHLVACQSVISIALTPSDTISLTWSTTSGSKAMIVEAMAGSAGSPVGIIGAGSTFTSTDTPSGPGAQTVTTPPSQMLFGAISWQLATNSIGTEPSGFTTTGADATLSNTIHLHVAYQDYTASGSVNYTPTFTTAVSETGVINQYGYVAGTSTGVVVCTRSLMGVGC
jgi:hypothetical protein